MKINQMRLDIIDKFG